MAKKYGFLICILVMVMDIIAGILGIQAETSQNKEKHMKIWLFDCRYPSHQAFKLGVAAIILLLLAHAIANLLGGCICVRSRDHHIPATANRQLAVAFQIFSWIVFAVALCMLIIGTLANARSKKYCGIFNHRFLFIGAILCFIHGVFTIPYYVSITAMRREEKRPQTPGPAVIRT
ncbi:protein DESIGUAL 2-like isoform X1 [Vicia villosa]|uniref:protein DESIGUAL 2-like isoform X1 n=1 Tax=Vicia villosa TaxID=3911 RepID=UPI00273C6AD5|nr:protein DESIGUAL 2-like isoform X1 [Vicia villosa]